MHEKRLLNNLLATYNTLERPVANESDPLVVKFGLTLQQIIDVVSVDLFNHFSVDVVLSGALEILSHCRHDGEG